MKSLFDAPIDLKNHTCLIYAEGAFGLRARKKWPMRAKTADGLLRYAKYAIAGVIDSSSKETRAGDVLPAYLADVENFSIPIFKNISEAKKATKASVLIIGTAPEGGELPKKYEKDIIWALKNRMHIISGMHSVLGSQEKFKNIAKKNDVTIWDTRFYSSTNPSPSIASAKAYHIKKPIVLTVGMDAAIGKMTTIYEMHKAAEGLGMKSIVIPTGQTTMMIEGWGAAIDALPADFMAGAVEDMIYMKKSADIIFVEGQGSLFHPAYANTCISLIHGAVPTHMVLVARPQRKHSIGSKLVKLPSIKEAIAQYENAVLPRYRNAKVIGVAVNSEGLSRNETAAYKKEIKKQTKLPAFNALEETEEVVKLVRKLIK